MASSSFTFTTNNKYITGRIRWSSVSNGSTANSSTVTAYLDFKKSSASTAPTSGTFGGYININGSTQNLSLRTKFPIDDSWVNVGSHACTVAHNSDGTKSIYITAYGAISGTTFSMSPYTKSGIALDNIPRYAAIRSFTSTAVTQTSVTMQAATDVTCKKYEYKINNGAYQTASGSTFTISGLAPNTSYSFRCRVTRSDSGLTTESSVYTVKTLPIASLTGTFDFNIGEDLTVSLVDSANNASTLEVYILDDADNETNTLPEPVLTTESPIKKGTCTLPLSTVSDLLYQHCPSSQTLNIRIVCGVHLNGTFYSNSYTGIATVTDSLPIFSEYTYGNSDALTSSVLGDTSYIAQNFGTMQVKITPENQAVPQNHAAITHYQIGIKSQDGNMIQSQKIPFSGSREIIADFKEISKDGTYYIESYAVDSRGFQSSVITKTFYVLPYHKPFAAVTLKRYNEFEKETLINLVSSYSKLMVRNEMKNTVFSAKYRYAETGAALPEEYTELAVSPMEPPAENISPDDLAVAYAQMDVTDPFLILDSSKSYYFEFVFTDRLSQTYKIESVIEGIPIMLEAENGKVSVGMIPEMTSPANLQVATDILATDAGGNQRLVLEEIDSVGGKVEEVKGELEKTNGELTNVKKEVTELNGNLSDMKKVYSYKNRIRLAWSGGWDSAISVTTSWAFPTATATETLGTYDQTLYSIGKNYIEIKADGIYNIHGDYGFMIDSGDNIAWAGISGNTLYNLFSQVSQYIYTTSSTHYEYRLQNNISVFLQKGMKIYPTVSKSKTNDRTYLSSYLLEISKIF